MEKEIKKSQKLIRELTAKHIKPIPRWGFVFKNCIVWSVFSLFIILGGVASSIILSAGTESDFSLLTSLPHSKIQFLISSLPFFWIFFLVVFLMISIFGARHTKTGYRHSLLKILRINILLSILLGTLFFYTGGAQRIENIVAQKIPAYKNLEEQRILKWSNPANGFLAGVILENKKKVGLLIEDFNDQEWEIDIQEALVRPGVSLEQGEKIKIIGEALEENIFEAQEIRGWKGYGARGKK